MFADSAWVARFRRERRQWGAKAWANEKLSQPGIGFLFREPLAAAPAVPRYLLTPYPDIGPPSSAVRNRSAGTRSGTRGARFPFQWKSWEAAAWAGVVPARGEMAVT